MKTKKEEKKPVYGHGVYHPGARPMQVYIDKDGCWWLCDKGIDLIRIYRNKVAGDVKTWPLPGTIKKCDKPEK